MKRDRPGATRALYALPRSDSAVVVRGPRKPPAGGETRPGQEAAPDHNSWINARPPVSRGPADISGA